MTRLIDWLQRAASALGLEIELGYEAILPGCEPIRPLARVLNLGGPMGMLVFGHFDEVRQHANELVGAGFGYTVLDEPRSDEAFDLESFKEMATDWGWAGPSSSRPPWLA